MRLHLESWRWRGRAEPVEFGLPGGPDKRISLFSRTLESDESIEMESDQSRKPRQEAPERIAVTQEPPPPDEPGALDALFNDIETELTSSDRVNDGLRARCDGLPDGDLAAVWPLLDFLGCRSQRSPATAASVVPKRRRIQGARLMLRYLKAHTDSPAWSSFLLEKLFVAVMAVPGGEMGDAILAMYDLLGEHKVSITSPTGHLIVEVVVGAFSRNRASFEASDLSRLKDDLDAPGSHITPAQAYLALNAVPTDALMARRDRLLALLSNTSYIGDAQKMLEPDGE